ncbi:MAG: hypothetical protein ACOX4F_02815 [Atopobiaceae bacterium]
MTQISNYTNLDDAADATGAAGASSAADAAALAQTIELTPLGISGFGEAKRRDVARTVDEAYRTLKAGVSAGAGEATSLLESWAQAPDASGGRTPTPAPDDLERISLALKLKQVQLLKHVSMLENSASQLDILARALATFSLAAQLANQAYADHPLAERLLQRADELAASKQVADMSAVAVRLVIDTDKKTLDVLMQTITQLIPQLDRSLKAHKRIEQLQRPFADGALLEERQVIMQSARALLLQESTARDAHAAAAAKLLSARK